MSTRSSTGSSLSPRDEEIREVVNDALLARIDGKVVSDESIIESHRDLMPELADQLRNLRLIQQAERGKGPASDEGLHIRCPHCRNAVEVVDNVTLSDLVCPSCGSHFGLVEDSPRTFAADELETIGHFKLLDKLGMGAYGSVWSARDLELDRLVAVKIPRKNQLSAEDAEQFVREARAAAQLSHPHIVRVHEVGRENDRVFIVSDFVHGLDLADWLSDQQPTPREAAELCATMADALQHAHDNGVIHRDLKPSNIMLDTSGDPHLMDFGLAKREAGEMTMTVEGKLLGTPAYMSPEQARGAAHDADARSDIYSLGVILFELLTGERPFRGSTRMLLHQVLVEDPPSPRKLNGRVPKDLETICLKCLEKAPDQRYQDAAELRDDLGRYLAGEPVLARPITKVARGWRWCKRKPVVAGLSATIACLLLFLGIAGPMVAWEKAELLDAQRTLASKESTARLAAEDARGEVENARKSLRQELYVADMRVAQQAIQRNQIAKVVGLLEQYQPTAGEEDLRGFGWYYLWAACQRAIMMPVIEEKMIRDVIYSPDGKTLIYADLSLGQVLYRDTKTAAVHKIVNFNNQDGSTLRYPKISPDGNTISLGLENNDIRLIDLNTNEESLLSGHAATVYRIAFSPDGKTLASSDFSNSVILWDVTAGRKILVLKDPADEKTHSGQINAVVFSPNGQTLATGSRDQTAKLWDVASGKLLETIKTDPRTRSSVWSVAFSPDGNMLAIGTSRSCVVLLWNIAERKLVQTLRGHRAFVTLLAFYDNGKKLASGSNIIRLWDVEQGKPLDSFRTTLRLGSPNGTLAVSPDDSTLAASDSNGVRLLQLSTPANPRVLRLPYTWDKRLYSVSPDGETIVIGHGDKDDEQGKIEVWSMTTGAMTSEFSHGKTLQAVSWNDSSRQVVSCGVEGKVKLWNADTRELLKTWEPESEDSKYVRARISNGDTLRALGQDPTLYSWYSWDLALANPLRQKLHSHKRRLTLKEDAFLYPGGQLLGAWSQNKSGNYQLDLWDASTDELIQAFPDYDYSMTALSVDSSLLAIGTSDGEVILWDIVGKKEIRRLSGHEGLVLTMRFSPDGQRLFCGDYKTVKIWDFRTGRLQFELDAHDDGVRGIFLTPDSQTLTTVSTDNTVKQWRAASEDEVQQMRERWYELQGGK